MEAEATVTPAPAAADWRSILLREVDADPRGKAGVAERLGVSRAYVSRALSSGTSAYAAVPRKFVLRVLDLEADIDCPAQGRKSPRATCRKANDPAPTHNPLAMRVWRECQQCPNKPFPEVK